MDELEISGKRYISARRAGKENKYTPDYIGQLIRGGKLVGQKVGRAWYVSEESLSAYLRGEALPTQAVVSEVAVAASEVTVEQMEGEEVVSKTVEELVTEIPEPKVVKVEAVIAEDAEVKGLKEESLVHIPITDATLTEEDSFVEDKEDAAQNIRAGLSYVTEDESLLPVLEKDNSISTDTLYIEESYKEARSVHKPQLRALSFVALGIIGAVVFGASAALSSKLVLKLEVHEGVPASAVWALE